MGEETNEWGEQPLDIESFRKRLASREEFAKLFAKESDPKAEPEVKLEPFFVAPAFDAKSSMIVVDFGLSRGIAPTVLVYFNGFLVEFDTSHDLFVPRVEYVGSPAAAPLRFLGKILNSRKLASSGIKEVRTDVKVSWDNTGADVIGWLTYLGTLAQIMGVERIGIIEQPGWEFKIPESLAPTVSFYLLPTWRGDDQRATAYEILKQYLNLRYMRVYEDGYLHNSLREVLVRSDNQEGKVGAGQGNSLVDAAAALCLSFILDEQRRMIFVWDR